MKYLIVVLVLIIIFIILYVFNNYQKIKELDDIISNSLDKLNELLNKKKELLEKLLKDTKNKELKVMIKTDENINIFDLENTLFEIKWKLNSLINNKEYKLEKEYIEYYKELNDIEESIDGLKDYYNSKVIIYNEKYLNKLFNKIYKLLHMESKKTFKLRKIDYYEILKN